MASKTQRFRQLIEADEQRFLTAAQKQAKHGGAQ
jgi:hypothetical protein